MKITVFELLKLVKEDKAPKEIKYDTMNYVFRNYDYKEIHGELIDEQSSWLERIDFYKFDEPVEILEEEKKIPEKLDYCEENTFMNKKETTYLSSEERRLLDSNFKELGNKINSIIDYLKSKGE